MGRLVILSGPSCVGKGPLHTALKKFYPREAERLQQVVLYNSREPRPVERDGEDYHFRPRAEIQAFQGDKDYLVMDVRGDLQALDLAALRDSLAKGDAFFEGNPFIGTALVGLAGVEKLSVFVSPLSREEIVELKDPARKIDLPAFVTDVMRRKLLRRTQRQKGILSLRDLENIEKRAGSAYREMCEAWRYQHVMANHDGEDSENWDAFYYPLGDARRSLAAFVALLQGETPPGVETWEPDLIA